MDHILICALPPSGWWKNGMPVYENNWMMAAHRLPRQDVVADAHRQFAAALAEHARVTVLPFPEAFDRAGSQIHDFIFVRDSFISDQHGSVIISNFHERARAPEATFMQAYLKDRGYAVQILEPDAYAEGGEFYYLPGDRMLFAGVSRSNRKGVTEVARLLRADLCVVETTAYHVDTVFSVIRSESGGLAAVLACLEMITNAGDVVSFCRGHGIPVIGVEPDDAIGYPDRPGSIAVNCLALPGVLLGCELFRTPGLEEALGHMGIRHVVCPLADLTFSGGAVHCLTNELDPGRS